MLNQWGRARYMHICALIGLRLDLQDEIPFRSLSQWTRMAANACSCYWFRCAWDNVRLAGSCRYLLGELRSWFIGRFGPADMCEAPITGLASMFDFFANMPSEACLTCSQILLMFCFAKLQSLKSHVSSTWLLLLERKPCFVVKEFCLWRRPRFELNGASI